MKSSESFDVVIIGAGPAGCAVASGLFQAGISNVAIVDKPIDRLFRIGESATPDVPGLLQQLGLKFIESGHRLYTRNLVSWGSGRIDTHDFLFRGSGNGWHLDRDLFDLRLRQSVVDKGMRIFSPDWLVDLGPLQIKGNTRLGWILKLHGGAVITAKVVVDASGRNAAFCKRLGIRWLKQDALIALACRVPDLGRLQGASFVNACEYGWWYAVTLTGGYCLVSLMTDTSIAKVRKLHQAHVFRQAWQENELLSQYVPAQNELLHPQTFAAYTGFLQQAAGKNWVAVGDALMGLDPLTSSGISGALSDAIAAVSVIKGQLEGNYGPAQQYALRANRTYTRYLAQRAGHYANEQRWANELFWSSRSGKKQLVENNY